MNDDKYRCCFFFFSQQKQRIRAIINRHHSSSSETTHHLILSTLPYFIRSNQYITRCVSGQQQQQLRKQRECLISNVPSSCSIYFTPHHHPFPHPSIITTAVVVAMIQNINNVHRYYTFVPIMGLNENLFFFLQTMMMMMMTTTTTTYSSGSLLILLLLILQEEKELTNRPTNKVNSSATRAAILSNN